MKGRLKSLAKQVYRRLPLKRQIFELIRGRVQVPIGIFQHLSFEGPFDVSIDPHHAFKIHHYGHIVENELFWRGFGGGWEATSILLWAEMAKNAQVVLDIGANSGVFALTAKAMNPAATVIAFEPAPRICERLQRNVALNEFDIEIVALGVSDTTGTLKFFNTTASHSYSASFSPEMLVGRADLTETDIPVTRLDDFLDDRQVGALELIKIDVEMHESEVLAGAARCLARDRPDILIEILTHALAEKVDSQIEDLGYLKFQVLEAEGLKRLERLTDGHFGRETRDWNFLLCRPEHAPPTSFMRRQHQAGR